MSQTTEPTHVEMRFEGVENTIQVPVRRVKRYKARGWKPAGEDAPEGAGSKYAGLKKPGLLDAIAARNADRPEAEQIDASGTVPQLRAALEADDAGNAGD